MWTKDCVEHETECKGLRLVVVSMDTPQASSMADLPREWLQVFFANLNWPLLVVFDGCKVLLYVYVCGIWLANWPDANKR